jgi:hypothetical protein
MPETSEQREHSRDISSQHAYAAGSSICTEHMYVLYVRRAYVLCVRRKRRGLLRSRLLVMRGCICISRFFCYAAILDRTRGMAGTLRASLSVRACDKQDAAHTIIVRVYQICPKT